MSAADLPEIPLHGDSLRVDFHSGSSHRTASQRPESALPRMAHRDRDRLDRVLSEMGFDRGIGPALEPVFRRDHAHRHGVGAIEVSQNAAAGDLGDLYRGFRLESSRGSRPLDRALGGTLPQLWKSVDRWIPGGGPCHELRNRTCARSDSRRTQRPAPAPPVLAQPSSH